MANYQERRQKYVTLKTRDILKQLPSFVFDFFRGIETTTGVNTRLAYAYDLRLYFHFLKDEVPCFKAIENIQDFKVSDLEKVKARDIECYMEYLSYYEYEKDNDSSKDLEKALNHKDAAFQERDKSHTEEHFHQNGQNGKARKLAALKTMYHYFYKQERITYDPTALVDMPKIYEKPIIKLDVDEVARLLDVVESGEALTEHQQRYHVFTKKRDLAIIALMLGTGIRVSECVGINIEDIDFKNNGIKITRKGGNETIIYFSREVEKILRDYLEERKEKNCKDEDKPLFLSLQNRRISVRSIQLLVKKYSQNVTRLKKITPHKLRSTFGTQLYQETGDIYLVADVLGHKDVNTTKKHYAQMEDARKRRAASIIKLRETD